MSNLIIDLQGFKNNKNNFIIKEICILNHQMIHHYIVKPPYDWYNLSREKRKESIWLTNNYHGFHWNDGFLTYNELKQKIFPLVNLKNIKIYTKGAQKVKWIRDLFKNQVNVHCINLENMGCNINLQEYKNKNVSWFQCNQHRNENSRCALQNVLILKDWMLIKNK